MYVKVSVIEKEVDSSSGRAAVLDHVGELLRYNGNQFEIPQKMNQVRNRCCWLRAIVASGEGNM